jgi:hypothetical protein
MNTREQLKQEVDQLPELLAQEVLDFLLFVRNRHNSAWPPGLFEKTAGAWQGDALEREPQGDTAQRLVLE